MTHEVRLRITGFLTSLVLTLLAYALIVTPNLFSLSLDATIITIMALAFLQSLIQLIFFIDVWKDKERLWNLSVFFSTVSIIFIIIFFSILIMNHLNYHMEM